jgi:hypothetical protein
MLINRYMSLDELAERMGSNTTVEQAQSMRSLLLNHGQDMADTQDVDDDLWNTLLGLV